MAKPTVCVGQKSDDLLISINHSLHFDDRGESLQLAITKKGRKIMRKQQGLTLIGMLLTVAVVVIGGIVIMRVIPVYLQNYEIKSSIDALAMLDPADFSTDTATNVVLLKKRLVNQFTINGLDDIKPEELTIVPDEKGNYTVHVKYTVVKPLVSNVSLMFEFDETREVAIAKK